MKFDHLIVFDKENLSLRIFRVMPEGERVFVTEVALPGPENKGWTDDVTNLAHTLGENLFMDSPVTRGLYKL